MYGNLKDVMKLDLCIILCEVLVDDKLLDVGRECNVSLNFNLTGGSGECDICFDPGEFVCRECQNQ